MNYLYKFRGQGKKERQNIEIKEVFFTFVGGLIAIGLIGFLTKSFDNLLVMGSFGASCVLIFAYPTSPFSQPKNIIFGHLFASFVGLVFLHTFGNEWWSMAIALATAIAVMMITDTVHPPAGSNPLIIFLLNAEFEYLIFPTLSGAIILVLVALFYNNLHKKRVYPNHWF